MDLLPTPQRLLDQSRSGDRSWSDVLKLLLEPMINFAAAKRISIVIDRHASAIQIIGHEADGIAQPISLLMWSTEADFALAAAWLADLVVIDSCVNDRREVLIAHWIEMAAEDRWKARRPEKIPTNLDGTTRFTFLQLVQELPAVDQLQRSADEAVGQLETKADVEVRETPIETPPK